MANEEHLKVLRQGVEAWNPWRKENPDTRPDLRQANLTKACLSEADLSKAWLNRADLTKAQLSRADLTNACLVGADLGRANLSRANLSGADLIRADLIRADLIRADLIEANLIRADLTGADFSGAAVGYTVFADLDLSLVRGLETVRHEGPSSISIDTMYKSVGKIPEAFLCGCGVPDNFIAYVGSLTGKGFEYYSCFISYSSKDDAFAQRLHNDLQGEGVRCWFASEDMKIGDKIRVRIDESIRIHDKLLLILSEHSVASEWVEHEVEHALDLERERMTAVLFPIRLDDAVMESRVGWARSIRRTHHIGDFIEWEHHRSYQQAFTRLLNDLKAEPG